MNWYVLLLFFLNINNLFCSFVRDRNDSMMAEVIGLNLRNDIWNCLIGNTSKFSLDARNVLIKMYFEEIKDCYKNDKINEQGPRAVLESWRIESLIGLWNYVKYNKDKSEFLLWDVETECEGLQQYTENFYSDHYEKFCMESKTQNRNNENKNRRNLKSKRRDFRRRNNGGDDVIFHCDFRSN